MTAAERITPLGARLVHLQRTVAGVAAQSSGSGGDRPVLCAEVE